MNLWPVFVQFVPEIPELSWLLVIHYLFRTMPVDFVCLAGLHRNPGSPEGCYHKSLHLLQHYLLKILPSLNHYHLEIGWCDSHSLVR